MSQRAPVDDDSGAYGVRDAAELEQSVVGERLGGAGGRRPCERHRQPVAHLAGNAILLDHAEHVVNQQAFVAHLAACSTTTQRLLTRSVLPDKPLPLPKGKERKSIYIALLWPRCYIQSTQTWITQFYLQITPCLPFLRHGQGRIQDLVAWSSGRTSVFGRRAFAVLRSTCS